MLNKFVILCVWAWGGGEMQARKMENRHLKLINEGAEVPSIYCHEENGREIDFLGANVNIVWQLASRMPNLIDFFYEILEMCSYKYLHVMCISFCFRIHFLIAFSLFELWGGLHNLPFPLWLNYLLTVTEFHVLVCLPLWSVFEPFSLSLPPSHARHMGCVWVILIR